MSNEPTRFWMIYGMGLGRPTHQHQTYDLALLEAKRLARNHPDVTFVVMEAVTAVCKHEFALTTLRDPSVPTIRDRDIPF